MGILDFANQEHVPLKFLARLLERQSWKMKPFLYENHICLLKYSKTAIHQNLSFDEKELHILEQLLEQYEYRIGVSNIFTELKRMKDAYAQAVFTLQSVSYTHLSGLDLWDLQGRWRCCFGWCFIFL